MAARDNLHSRVVFWLKIALPLAALVILSTLFLVARRIDTDAALPYTDINVEELARDRRMIAPQYSGVTSDGGAVTMDAETAWPDADGGNANAKAVVAAYDLKDGQRIDLVASTGGLDNDDGRMRLGGGVEIVTSSGYRMVTAGLDGALDRTELLSDGRVDAEAPYGTIEAGSMEISHSGAENDGYVLVFKNGVKLIYDPVK
jgi:lipopolysaccharide export system protein LptC